MILGIVGGIGSGKSHVTQLLKQKGCCSFHADHVVHRSLELPAVVDQLRARWLIDEQGYITCDHLPHVQVYRFDWQNNTAQRQNIAGVVFGNPSEREFLETVLWPEVNKEINTFLEHIAENSIKAAVLDVPLLFEGGWDNLCDKIIFVSAPVKIRVERYMVRTELSYDLAFKDLTAREGFQLNLEEKQTKSDFVIVNDGTKDVTLSVNRVYNELLLSINGKV